MAATYGYEWLGNADECRVADFKMALCTMAL